MIERSLLYPYAHGDTTCVFVNNRKWDQLRPLGCGTVQRIAKASSGCRDFHARRVGLFIVFDTWFVVMIFDWLMYTSQAFGEHITSCQLFTESFVVYFQAYSLVDILLLTSTIISNKERSTAIKLIMVSC